MPRRPPKPPSFDELIDELVDRAGDFLKDRLAQFMPQVDLPPTPRRVKGQSQGRGRAPAGRGQGGGPKTTPRARTPIRTAYTVLGVDPGAEQEVLVAAYRAKARLYHPDTCRDPKVHIKITELMKELNAAWDILKDPVKRKQYDKGMGL